MKGVLQKILLVGCLLVTPSIVFAEEITSFISDITINQSGTIGVVETIDYDFGNEDRHGIFRTIPLVKTNTEGKRFRLGIEIGNITDEKTKQVLTKYLEAFKAHVDLISQKA